MEQQDGMRITGTSRCPYCAGLTFQVTYTIAGGSLSAEGECLRCMTLGRSFRYQPVKQATNDRASVKAVNF
jgi:hypothetical protein